MRSKTVFLLTAFLFTASLLSSAQEFSKRIIPDADYFSSMPNLTFKNPSGAGFYAFGNNYYDSQYYPGLLPVFMLLHFDDAGEIIWQKGFFSEKYFPKEIFRDAVTGNLTLVGQGTSAGSIVVYCLDNSGTILYTKDYFFNGYTQIEITDVIETSDGAIGVLIGCGNGNNVLLKISKQSDVLWCRKFNNSLPGRCVNLFGDPNGNIYVLMADDLANYSRILGLNTLGGVTQELVVSEHFDQIVFDQVSGFFGVNDIDYSYTRITRFNMAFEPIWVKRTLSSFIFKSAMATEEPGELLMRLSDFVFHVDSSGAVYDVVKERSNLYFYFEADFQIASFLGLPQYPEVDTNWNSYYGNLNNQNMNNCLFEPSTISLTSVLPAIKWSEPISVQMAWEVEQVGSALQVNLQNSTLDFCPSITDVSEITDAMFQVYPLPANDVLHVNIDFSEHGSRMLECLNLQGELVFSSEVNSGTFDYSVSSLPSGIYLLRIGSQVQKIVIQH